MSFDVEKYLRRNPTPSDDPNLDIRQDDFSDDQIEKMVEREGVINKVHYNLITGKTSTLEGECLKLQIT